MLFLCLFPTKISKKLGFCLLKYLFYLIFAEYEPLFGRICNQYLQT